ncbi:MAG: hypothetical protein NTX97_00265, partial [Bacteroidetes bacterium]|nr:hypothetical protein [Bacteroidota bacterium]
MDKANIRKEISVLINSIKEHSDNIGNKEHIPQLELELILHKIEKLYQKSIVFNHLNSYPNDKGNKQKGNDDTVIIAPIVQAPVVELKKEVEKPAEIIDKPIDLFGTELPLPTEKSKIEKKIEKKEEKVADKNIQSPAITDITKAIALNDKFLFANELFGGNMQEYNIAIQQLNSAESLASAMDYFSNLQLLYE